MRRDHMFIREETMKLLKTLAGAAAALSILAASAVAQTYPERSITMVVPFSAGGPTDTVARLVAESMSKDLGQQIIVENVGGAGGTLGANRVAQADPDGYTLLLYHIGVATFAALYPALPYVPADFTSVGLITEVPMTIVGRKDLPPADITELLAYLQDDANQVTFGTAGVGAVSHLCGMLLQEATGTEADCLFLELMIRHHEGAIPMAETLLELGTEARPLQVAESIKAGQTAEIDAMKSIQQRLGCG